MRLNRRFLASGILASLLFLPGASAFDETPPAAEKKKFPANRLAKESSPYLLLHAHNPVDWYPWGPEAFEKAKQDNKPIFLSIGYSSCYWCHVMERLVFENETIAEMMNEHFVNVKVDREERPDVDDIYMTSLIVYYQLIRSPQGGGWPLSMFLTPEGKPFAGGTYFPPEDIDGRLGFPTVLTRVHELWTMKREEIESNAEVITGVVRKEMKPKLNLDPVALDESLVRSSVTSIEESYDPEQGGVDFNVGRPNGPKFPVPSKLRLLLDRARKTGDEKTTRIVLHSLEAIAMGGIRDHLGGGFHRYSTDRAWHVPHFEKMLYDQAQLVPLYLDAWQMTKRPLFRQAAVETLEYVLSEMTGAAGQFYSALDAETEGVEGKYYVWSKAEIEESLGEADAIAFAEVFGMNEPNPFEHGFVLHLPRSREESARNLGIADEELDRRIAGWREALLAVRAARPQPLLDDKAITSWNGLMIAAFAQGGKILNEPKYLAAAEHAADFLLTKLRGPDGELSRTYRNGTARLNAYLDDYAFAVDGLLHLYEATGRERWLSAARELTAKQHELFWDETAGGYYFTSHDHEELIVRTKNAFDAVIPSGNSVAALNLVRLARLTGDETYLDHTEQIFKVFAPVFSESPRGLSLMSLALADYLALRAAEKKTGRLEGEAHPESATLPVALQLEEQHKVKLQPYLNVDKLPPGSTCRIVLYVEIDAGWHINANPSQPEFYPPTVFRLKSEHGVKLKNVRYPKGKEFRLKGIDDVLLVYDGKIPIYAELDVPAEAAGKTDPISLELEYQACDDKNCLRKTTASVGGKVQVATRADESQPINERHFPKE